MSAKALDSEGKIMGRNIGPVLGVIAIFVESGQTADFELHVTHNEKDIKNIDITVGLSEIPLPEKGISRFDYWQHSIQNRVKSEINTMYHSIGLNMTTVINDRSHIPPAILYNEKMVPCLCVMKRK